MNRSLTVKALFEALEERLQLDWGGGRTGATRVIRFEPELEPVTALIGHLNFIHPLRIQVLGRTELDYLASLESPVRRATLQRLFDGRDTDLVLVAEALAVPSELRQHAEATSLPLLVSALPSHELISHIQYFLDRRLAERITLHGVFMEVIGLGVLLTGDASIGKSELALDLISRGHRLIADDAPEFERVAPDTLSGSCPTLLRDFIEVRGLGVLNARAMFGDSAIKPSKYLRLIIRLERMSVEQLARIDRLRGNRDREAILGVEVDKVTLPVAPGRNLAVMVETAVRNQILILKGYDGSQAFLERQQRALEAQDV